MGRESLAFRECPVVWESPAAGPALLQGASASASLQTAWEPRAAEEPRAEAWAAPRGAWPSGLHCREAAAQRALPRGWEKSAAERPGQRM
jgi:hypothetical protein